MHTYQMLDRLLLPDDPNYPAKRRLWVKDPIDGERTLRDSSRDILFNWCDENCQGRFWVGMGFMDFELDDDYVLAIMHHSR
jgi:hypothetical protein